MHSQRRHGVGEQVIEQVNETKDEVVVSGANGQATDVMVTTRGKATYASVLKRPAAHACGNDAYAYRNDAHAYGKNDAKNSGTNSPIE
jgi:hypothetical protein